MFCSNCGKRLESTYKFCPDCGCAVNNANGSNMNQEASSNAFGTLVAVMLLGGVMRNLYFRNGMYFYDHCCKRPFPMGMICQPFHHHHHSVIGNPMWFFGPHHHHGGFHH